MPVDTSSLSTISSRSLPACPKASSAPRAASADEGDELTEVKTATDRLTREHRTVEALCKHLEPELKKMAKGQPCDLDIAGIETLIREYSAHARYEEDEFLPKSEVILNRNPTEHGQTIMQAQMQPFG